MKRIRDFLSSESGATAIEYGLIGMLVAIVTIGAMTFAGTGVANIFNYIRDSSVNLLNRQF